MTPSPAELVGAFGRPDGTTRFATYQALIDLGPKALPALREGLRSPDWQVRRWSAICLDRLADSETLQDLVQLLDDPHAAVRLWAVHALACDHCKDDVQCPQDVVPRLLELVRGDPSIRVRRMTVIMLGSELRDVRAVPVLEEVAATSSDAKLPSHAQRALETIRTGEPASAP